MYKIYVVGAGENTVYVSGIDELPKEGTYYVLAGNGLFLSKDTGLIRALIPVSSIGMLPDLAAKAEINLPKIPLVMMAQVVSFFRKIYADHHAESIVLLYYCQAKKEFMLISPGQEVSAGSIDYKPESKFDAGFQLVGTIHSHCDFRAFHSTTDIGDEKDFDGLHITIGRVDQLHFTVSSQVVVNAKRFPIEVEDVIEGIAKVDFQPTLFGRKLSTSSEQFYDLIFLEKENYQTYPFPEEWLKKVKSRFFGDLFSGKSKKSKEVSVTAPQINKEVINVTT